MSKKRLITVALTAVLSVCCMYSFVVGSTSAHAASSQQVAGSYHAVTTSAKQIDTHVNQAACGGITTNFYWWGIEWYVPKCAAQQLADGANLIPKAGPIASYLIKEAINLSCNGSIYIDLFYPAAFASVVRPAC